MCRNWLMFLPMNHCSRRLFQRTSWVFISHKKVFFCFFFLLWNLCIVDILSLPLALTLFCEPSRAIFGQEVTKTYNETSKLLPLLCGRGLFFTHFYSSKILCHEMTKTKYDISMLLPLDLWAEPNWKQQWCDILGIHKYHSTKVINFKWDNN